MKITVNKQELTTAVKAVLPFTERKTTIPILSNFMLQAEADKLAVTGTDLDVALTVTKDVQVKKEGRITVPARKLADVLAKLKTVDADKVTIEAGDGLWATVSCGTLTVKLAGMDAKNYPTLTVFEGETVDIPGEVLDGLIARTKHAIGDEEPRYTLNGALLVIEPGQVRMVATDGHKLSLAEHAGTFKIQSRTLLPKKAIERLPNLLADVDVTFGRTEDRFFLSCADWQMQSRILTGQFPNWEAVMPKDNRKRVTIPAQQLKETLARVSGFADERSGATRWQLIGGQGIKLSASSTETGEASELVKVACEDDCTVGFRHQYVSDILQTVGKGQAVTLALRDHESAGLWTPAETNGFVSKHVLMPIRL